MRVGFSFAGSFSRRMAGRAFLVALWAAPVCAFAGTETVSLDGVWKFFPAFEEIEANHGFLGHAGATDTSASGPKHSGWIEPEFDDSAWWDIRTPGSWNTQFDDLWSYEGEGWHRKKLPVPAEWAGKRVVFECDGANYRTVVYVNGQYAGEHEGGFTRFSVPIHAYLRFGEMNALAVVVDNKSALDRVPMERHDWWQHGGLYRPARLVVSELMYIDRVTVTTQSLGEPATVAARVRVASEVSPGAVALSVRLLHPGGAEAARSSCAVTVSSGAGEAELRLLVPGARFWSPESPFLYTLETELRLAEGSRVLDRRTERIGLRVIEVNGDELLLNGQPYLIKGVNRYENYADSGMTNTEENLARDIALIKGLGANAVRCHYPYSPQTYDALDEAGLLAVCEIPLYQWGRPGHSEKNIEAAQAQLTEMIATLGNHPSIAFWSVSNETRTRPREPGEEHERLSAMVVRGNLALIDLAHALDPTRPVVAPSNRWPDDPVFAGTDINSVNVYLGVAAPHVSALAAMPGQVHEQFDALRALYPNRPILVTEFGSWALRGLKTDYFPGELYQAALLETEWKAFEHEPGFVGGFVWCFADSDVHRKFTTIYEMRCAYGLYDLHRRPKAAADTMRALWTTGRGGGE